jgi:D-alanyl-D-alanine carboxypeptidase
MVPAGIAVLVALVIAGPPDSSPPHEPASLTPGSLTAQEVRSDLPVAPPIASTTTMAPGAPSTGTTAAPVRTTSTTRRAVTPATAPPSAPTPTPPGFEGSVREIDAATAARMSASWRPGCPVPLRDLRLVTITHWGFDGRPRPGELVVHAAHAGGIRRVFAELFAAQFPIEQVRLVDEFGGDDDRSMAANNTSGFNCRPVRGSARWSQHAYGRAIDINPLQNPYVTRGGVHPPGGREYLRRDADRQGLITARGPVATAFARIGWRWGGAWSNPDYQHFSANGR